MLFWGLSGLCGIVNKLSIHNCALYLLLSFLRAKYETELQQKIVYLILF